MDDLISRQAAIDIFDDYNISVENGDLEAYCSDRKRLCELPSAQPERIKGHWIKISPANIYECSECGKSVMTNDICAYDFCHGCGAEMESEVTE